MSKIEKMLQCNDCKDKLDKLCEQLDYNDVEREIAAEVLLWLEMGKLKSKSLEDAVNSFSLPQPVGLWDSSANTIKC
ncbi:MAG: hypothetical protein GOVbin2917_83 [Prokaryotic dsDNA virus sp.]|jgi:hypothetical protein|nr:MAG: hypothetical protein GOVbin2917_83 [Prokaryotic dsDNA virus sp.]|tara:strand:+ start:44264 stop:44494 length:231 start_codon:yes stop_codon:yes gene_type:complete